MTGGLIERTAAGGDTRRVSGRAWWAIGLLVALLVAGVGSYYASSNPDGLQYVAQKTGFGDQAEHSAATESPLAGYRTRGVENPRTSRGLAGVAGLLLVLTIAGGGFWLLRRRPSEQAAGVASTTVDDV